MFIGGGQVGFNYQFSTLVVGLESEFEGIGSNNHNRGVLVPALGDTFAITSNDRWLALVTPASAWPITIGFFMERAAVAG
jgi:hypothetical protein